MKAIRQQFQLQQDKKLNEILKLKKKMIREHIYPKKIWVFTKTSHSISVLWCCPETWWLWHLSELEGELEVQAHFVQMITSAAGRYQQIILLVTLISIDLESQACLILTCLQILYKVPILSSHPYRVLLSLRNQPS